MNIRLISAVVATLLAAPPAAAEWRLSPDESRIGFVSIKAGLVAESHYFKEARGSVSKDGAAEIVIPLDSVETNIEIRNERMREFLFETDAHPITTVSATVDLNALSDLAPGARESVAISGEVTLHGATTPFDATLIATRLGDARVLVETTDPIILYTDDFGLAPGVQKLMELAGLPSIAPVVPVSASLVFEREE